METILSETQHGFRKGRRCLDCNLTVAQVIEKHRECQLPTYITVVNFMKAFDRVNRGRVWAVMAKKPIPKHLIRAIQSGKQNRN